jgi:signal transduction histidine kinase
VNGDAQVALRRTRDLERPAGPDAGTGWRLGRGVGGMAGLLRPRRFYLAAGAILAALGILAGTFRSVDFVDAWNTGPWPVYAVVFGATDRVFGAWALLQYPWPRLKRGQRIFLVVLAGWMLVGRVLVVVTSTARSTGYPASSWWPTLFRDLWLSNVIDLVRSCGEGILAITLIGFLVARLLETKGLDRIVLTPIIAAGLAAVIAASATAIAQLFSNISTGPTEAYVAEGLADVTVPIAFLVAVIQRGLLARNLAELSAKISIGADLGSVRHALRETLHDPTLEVLEFSDSEGPASNDDGKTDGRAAGQVTGVAVLPGVRKDSRLVEVIRTDAGAPIAVVIADAALARYRGLFDAAVRTSGLALNNAQLQAQAARTELDHVRASRARLVEAGLAERRRLERDLHDGAQQHLLGMAARLTAAMARTADPEATAAFGRARVEIGEILAKLRDLAHGIHPATLAQGGLSAALEEVAERLPLAIDLDIPPDRAAPGIEAAAYFVACEALSNALKHANAVSVTVTVRISASQLEMEIHDDGIGGANPAGGGFANIMDRVSALDGHSIIDSPPGSGTRILVRIPCG